MFSDIEDQNLDNLLDNIEEYLKNQNKSATEKQCLNLLKKKGEKEQQNDNILN